MKRLYESIETVHIKGGVNEISDMIRTIDSQMQSISENTEKMTEQLVKFAASNKGKQFEKVVTVSMRLRDNVYEASVDINELQNQLVEFQNKVCRYEEITSDITKANAFIVTRRKIGNIDTTTVQVNRSEMMGVINMLRKYNEYVFNSIKKINQKKTSIAMYWCDVQYEDFAAFIDGVSKEIINALKSFEEFTLELEERVKELG